MTLLGWAIFGGWLSKREKSWDIQIQAIEREKEIRLKPRLMMITPSILWIGILVLSGIRFQYLSVKSSGLYARSNYV